MERKCFDVYFKFGIVRNPWDWQVSLYTYMLNERKHRLHDTVKSFNSFDEYLEWRYTKPVTYQKNFLFSEKNEQLVDFIGRVEKDFNKICSRIGISATLPRRNVFNIKPYQEYYNKKTIDIVKKKLEPDIELFKYDFE